VGRGLQKGEHSRRPIYISNSNELAQLMKASPVGRWISLSIEDSPLGRQLQWQKRLNESVPGCGCFAGGSMFSVTLTGLFGWLVWSAEISLLVGAVAAILVAFTAGLATKVVAVAIGRVRFRSTCRLILDEIALEKAAATHC
jgi:hypothetical protein